VDDWLSWTTIKPFVELGGYFILLMMLLKGIFKLIAWSGKHVVEPGRDRLFKHLDSVDNSMSKIGDHLEVQTTVMTVLQQQQKESHHDVTTRLDKFDHRLGKLERRPPSTGTDQ
jgi:hypothetical protein